MPKESFATITKRRLLGVLFLAIAVGFVSLSIAIYEKAFTSIVEVQLRADHTGNQLLIDSDVKERGVIVGSVKAVRANGTDAIVSLALQPGRVKDIPSNVTAQILPKTLFGEQYVALTIPKNPSAPIKAGDVIPQDRSKGALEAQDVLGDLLPLLTAVQPAELNSTLNALATALQGRGTELGKTLVNFDKYLKVLNPQRQQIVDDIQKLGQVSLEYNAVAPDIFASLQNLQTSARTIVEKKSQLDSLLTSGISTADTLRAFIAANKQNAISIVGQTDKIYSLLASYSPEFKCLFQGVDKLQQLGNTTISNKQIHLSVVLDNTNQGKYVPGEQPRIVTGYGPNCFGLPDNPQPIVNGKFQIPSQYRCLNDGAALTRDACGKSPSSVGSPEENALVNVLIAHQLGTTPDKVPGGATILTAPILRGQQVAVK
jgi:phospholipid/cholesterol/gamma-HCH transport system substrate-binding protein